MSSSLLLEKNKNTMIRLITLIIFFLLGFADTFVQLDEVTGKINKFFGKEKELQIVTIPSDATNKVNGSYYKTRSKEESFMETNRIMKELESFIGEFQTRLREK